MSLISKFINLGAGVYDGVSGVSPNSINAVSTVIATSFLDELLNANKYSKMVKKYEFAPEYANSSNPAMKERDLSGLLVENGEDVLKNISENSICYGIGYSMGYLLR